VLVEHSLALLRCFCYTCYVVLFAGKGRGLFTSAAVASGDLLMVAQPLALLYCEEGTTPENEELADALAAAVAAASTTAAQAASGSSSSSGGLALWQQHALLQLKAAGEGQDGAGAEQQQQLLLQLLGDSADVAAALKASSSSSSSGEEADKQQQQQLAPLDPVAGALPSADRVLQIVHANCTGGRSVCQQRLSR
jgi:hypothetical protein